MLLILVLMIMLMMLFYSMMNLNMMITLEMFDLFNLNLSMMINSENVIFSMVILIISMMVLLFCKFYFNFELKNSFKINLMIFILSMIMLVNSNSFLTIIISWDGLGISSYYLISFYSNNDSMVSSLITFFFNRMGDSFLMLSLSILIFKYSMINMMNINMTMLIMIFLGLITKSSQLPFGVWLPMAMSAPTPISSLVHSSTLVTAGILILMKMNFLYYSMNMMLMLFSILTFALGGMFSFCILDMKKAVAFSTLSQLGFILFSMSIGNMEIAYCHLIYHAFFKSSLFINLGFYMMNNMSNQDLRMFKNFSKNMIFKMCFIISLLNLMGLVSTCGFISKDMILIMFLNMNYKILIMMIMYMGCIFTGMYSLKFFMILFFNNLKYMKLSLNMKMNMYMIHFIFSSMMLIVIPMFFSELIKTNMMMMISSNSKIMFYVIILFSIILIKFIMNNLIFFFMILSNMINIMFLINNFINNLFYYLMNNIIKIMFLEEFIQLSMIKMMMKLNYINKMLINMMEISILLMLMINLMNTIL